MALFLRANIHQGDDLFSNNSKGKQCAFMTLSAILTAQNIPLIQWSKMTIDNILIQGDKMYLNALSSGFVVLDPRLEFMSVDDLPKVVRVSCVRNMFSYQICQTMQTTKISPTIVTNSNAQNTSDLPVVVGQLTSDLPVVVAQNTSDLPVVVAQNTSDLPVVVTQNTIDVPVVVTQNTSDLPVVVAQNTSDLPVVVAQNTSDLPVVVAQNTSDLPVVVAQNTSDLPVVVAQNTSDLPVVVAQNTSVEPQEDQNENEFWVINYGKELQSLVITDQEIDSHYYDIHTALLNTFLIDNYAILILQGYMLAIMKQTDSFYLFDSHARDHSGMPDPNGTAVVMKFTNILELEQYLYCLSVKLHTNSYEIVPVQVNKCKAVHQRTKYAIDQEKRHSLGNEGDKQSRLQKTSKYKKQKQLCKADLERKVRLQKISQCKKRKQSNETDIEQKNRLQKANECKKRRRSEESDNERQIRLEKDRLHKKQKRSEETNSQRQIRLETIRLHKKQKQSEETDSERQIRLEKDRLHKKQKQSEETDSQRQIRLEKDRLHKKQKRSQETDSERQIRLEKKRLNKKQRAPKRVSQHEISQQEYLETFDITQNGGIEEQCWTKANIKKFHKSMQYIVSKCTVCQEAWPLKSKPTAPYECSRCLRDTKSPKKFSYENSMIPSSVPHELQNLTQIEEMLIARALPIMRIYIKPGGQRGYSGHCINLPQNVTELATSLPRYPKDLAVIIVKVKGKENTFKDVTVRREKVHNALVWLINNNPHYLELTINEDALDSLPVNGVPQDLMTDNDIVPDDVAPSTDNTSEDIVYNHSTEMSSFLPVGEQQQQEIEAVRNNLSQSEPMPWPSVDSEPLNEYQVSHLATMAFPTLFPDGKGDPTNQALLRDVSLQVRIKHLLKFSEIIDGKWVYRFANHPRFSYWAFNMIQRKRILQQSGIFLKQNPGEAHLTIDELREMAASNNSNVFMSKVSRYVGNIAGTNAYWNRVREELKAIITSVGAPTLFFTFSSADMHWPELHALFKADSDIEIGNSTSEVRRQNVINNPHVVDWFFTQRLESFVKHWLYDTLGAKWHWFRYEYQGRGSIHCHGTAKLNNDPGLCQLTQTALQGFLAQKFKDENDCSDTTELDQDIEAGQRAADTVCQYVDWLLSTVNPNPPDEDIWIRPETHPCQRSYNGIPEHEKQSDYVDLLNMVQRHTRCSTSYCLRKKSNETELKCRFHFPFDICPKTKLEFEKIHSSGDNEHYRAKIVTKRNDSRLNNHQQLQLQGWRANCDIQVVIDHYACVEYLTKYAAKGEPRSPMLKQAFNSIV